MWTTLRVPHILTRQTSKQLVNFIIQTSVNLF
jgi:hypothetical protein